MRYRYLPLVAAGALALLLLTRPARAQEAGAAEGAAGEQAPTGAVQPQEPAAPPDQSPALPPRRRSFGMMLGGGVQNFADSQLRGQTNVGGRWGAGLIFGTQSPIAFEAAYSGSAQGVEAIGVSDAAVLVSNGLSGALRLNFMSRLHWQPYVSGGIGWRRYAVVNTQSNTSDLRPADDIMDVPAAVGLAYHTGTGFIVDLRGQYDFTFFDDLLRDPTTSPNQVGAGLDSWTAMLTVGAEF